MKRSVRLTIMLGLALGLALPAHSAIISINMTDGGSLGPPSPINTAGAVLAGYWNEIQPSGAPTVGTDLSNLTDDSGAASGVSLVQSDHVGGWWNSDAYPSGFSGTIGNDMFGNFSDTDFAYNYTFSNVNVGVGACYEVYIYSARGFANTGVTQFDVNGETKFLVNENTVGDYAESGWSSQALAEANANSGNYVRFQNVSLDTLVVGINGLEDLTSGGVAGSVAGIQIVAVPCSFPPSIDDQPEDQFLVLGDTNTTVTFSAVVSGSAPLSLQWDKGGVPIPGATNNSLVVSQATPADVGTYTLTATNALGTASDAGDLILITAPVVPAPQAWLVGDSTSFGVTMPEDSTGYLYQWKLGGVDLGGATNENVELTGLTIGDSGNYTVTVTLGADEATSDPAALVVAPLPTNTYATVVSNSSPLIWWRLGETVGSSVASDELGLNDADIITDTVMGVPGALLGDADSAAEFPGTADSKVELVDGSNAMTPEFTVEFWAAMAGGSGFRSPVTCRDIFGGSNGGWTFYLNDTDTWEFWLAGGGSETDWATITGPQAAPGIWTHVVGTYDGTDMKLYVDGSLVGMVENAPYSELVGANPLWIGSGETEDLGLIGDFFWVGEVDEVALYDRAIGAGEVVDHWAARYEPGTAPEITVPPQFAWALPGGDASFSVAARGVPVLQYQWRKDGVKIPGATETTLLLTDVQEADGGFYSAVVSNGGGHATSSAAELFIPAELSGTYQDMVLADAPVAYWPLDESNGVVAADAVGTNDGAVVNGAALGEPGAIPGDAGTSYGFAQASTQKVDVAYAADLNPTNFTIEAWARVTGGTDYRSLLTSRDDGPRGYIFYASSASSWEFWTGSGADGWSIMDWGQGVLTDGKWYHLVGTYDGTTKSFYVDGRLVGTENVGIAPNTNQVLRIGAGSSEQDPGEWFFEGGIDEVAIYDQVLGVKQIVNHFAAGVAAELVPMTIDLQGGMITVTWDGDGVLQQSEDLPGESWGDVPGDPASPYAETSAVTNRSFRLREQ